jgi:hypothetical protein
MPNKENLWYRVGYALETVRNRLPAPSETEAQVPASGEAPAKDVTGQVMDTLLTVGAGSLLARVFSLWPSRKGPGLFRLFRAGGAGAAAALLAELVRPVLSSRERSGRLEEELTDVLLTGAGRGLLYAALVEPRVPGPPILQGAAYGGLEYLLSPWGGLGEVAGSKAPQGRIPALSVLLKDRGADEDLIEHVAFGVAMAILYTR